MDDKRTALIVIDVQQSFRHRPYWDEAELPAFIGNLQTLVYRARRERVPVVQVFHEEEGDGPFSRGSGLVTTMPELAIEPDVVFRKNVHSALYARDAQGQTLEAWLHSQGVGRLVVTGIRTEQCCETTTRHASDAGFDVRYVTAATLTFAMTAPSGRGYSPQDIRDRTELVLAGRFATIVGPEAAFA